MPKISRLEPECGVYSDLPARFAELRGMICNGLGDRYHPLTRVALDGFGKDEEFERDSLLREALAEVLLACILWVEDGGRCEEILQCFGHGIKSRLVLVSNLFQRFLELRSALQKEGTVGLGTRSTAWIHLFVEFRDELVKPRWSHWLRQTLRPQSLFE